MIVHLKDRKGDKYEGLFDTEDFNKVTIDNLSWHTQWDSKTQSRYVKATKYLGKINGKNRSTTIYLHHLIMPLVGKGSMVDHINHNTLDNRKTNLRMTDDSRNTKNRRGANPNNKSGYRNVSWNYNKWYVQLQIDGVNTVLGKFDDVHEAGKYAEKMRKKHYGDYAGRT